MARLSPFRNDAPLLCRRGCARPHGLRWRRPDAGHLGGGRRGAPGSPLDAAVAVSVAVADDSGVRPADAALAFDANRPSEDAGPATSNIAHVVILVQENHAFDTYFGRYCTADAGSAPSCNSGPTCCEAAPATDPSGASPTTLDDGENAAYDPTHTQACELEEMNDGGMDRYTAGAYCSDAPNFALVAAGDVTVHPYRDYATKYVGRSLLSADRGAIVVE